MPKVQIDVTNCHSCKRPHQGVEIHELSVPVEPWTHWYTCPATDDPEYITLKFQKQHGVNLNESMIRELVSATHSGKWLVGIFKVENDKVFLNRICENFPTEKFQMCVDLLARNLEEEVGPPPAGPLPEGRPKPRVNLFGAQNGGVAVIDGKAETKKADGD